MAKSVSTTKHTSKKPIPKTGSKKQTSVWAPGMPFGKINYLLMIGSILILLLGYFLLSGGGTDNPTEFSEAIFDTRRLYIAPIVLVIGFLIEFVAIMYRPKIKEEEENSIASENKE